jgi:hypothetical protein
VTMAHIQLIICWFWVSILQPAHWAIERSQGTPAPPLVLSIFRTSSMKLLPRYLFGAMGRCGGECQTKGELGQQGDWGSSPMDTYGDHNYCNLCLNYVFTMGIRTTSRFDCRVYRILPWNQWVDSEAWAWWQLICKWDDNPGRDSGSRAAR